MYDSPYCKHGECFACNNGKCGILISSDFGEKRICPFFKTEKQYKEESKKYNGFVLGEKRKRR